MKFLPVLLCLSLCLPAFAAPPPKPADKPMLLLTGTIELREPAPLAAEAKVRVELTDTRTGKPIAEAEWPLATRKSPFRFALPYYIVDGKPGPHYQLRATLTERGTLRFVTPVGMPVLRTLTDRDTHLVLEKSGAASAPSSGAAPAPNSGAAPALNSGAAPALGSGAAPALGSGAAPALGSGATLAPISGSAPESGLATQPGSAPVPTVVPVEAAGPPAAKAATADTPSLPVITASVAAPTPATLEDSYWRLDTIDGKPIRLIPGEREPHLVLFAGRLNANSGCNKLLAPYTLPAANAIRFGVVGSTRMACPPGYANQEIDYLAALAAITRYRIEGRTLWLDDAHAPRLKFELRELAR